MYFLKDRFCDPFTCIYFRIYFLWAKLPNMTEYKQLRTQYKFNNYILIPIDKGERK